MRIHIGVVILIAAMLCCSGCRDGGTGPTAAEWEFLGFEDKFALRLVLAEPYLYVCAGSDGLWRRNIRESGSGWQYLGLADTSLGRYINRGVQDVVIHEQVRDRLLVAFLPDQGTDHGVYWSLDAGLTWTPADSGLEWYYGSQRYFYHVQRFLRQSQRIIAASSSIYALDDWFAPWKKLADATSVAGDAYVLVRPKFQEELIWLGGENYYFSPFLSFSTNRGASWQEIDLQQIVPHDNAIYSIDFDPGDPNVVYVGMQGAIIKTTNSGESWIVPLVTNRRGEFFRAILADPRDRNHLWAAGGPDLIETWDAGLSWRSIESPILNTTKVFEMLWDEKQEVIYVATLNGIYRLKP